MRRRSGRRRGEELLLRLCTPEPDKKIRRHRDGTGSGRSGDDAVAWSQLDVARVSAQAIEKAESSRNPVAIEPGRYTTILEPQAVGDLVGLMPRSGSWPPLDSDITPLTKQLYIINGILSLILCTDHVWQEAT